MTQGSVKTDKDSLGEMYFVATCRRQERGGLTLGVVSFCLLEEIAAVAFWQSLYVTPVYVLILAFIVADGYFFIVPCKVFPYETRRDGRGRLEGNLFIEKVNFRVYGDANETVLRGDVFL